MKKELMDMAHDFCKNYCKYNDEPCMPEDKCPLEIVQKFIQEGDMKAEKKAEKTLKRIKEQIEWCDDIQNNNDESPESKQTAKRIAYDFIRKIIKEEGKND